MSNVTNQKCDICGEPSPLNSQWIRIPQVGLGISAQPIRFNPPRVFDACPTCASKTTIDKLPALFAKIQAAK
jgi:hypothetical protein